MMPRLEIIISQNIMKLKNKLNLFSSSEELISMFLGLVIVIVIAGLLFSFFQKRKGVTSVPGVTVTQNNENKTDDSETMKYIVKKGDNLWKIAVVAYGDGYKWTEIAKENKLTNPGIIEKDQKLILPKIEGKEVSVVIDATDKTEIVGKGEINTVTEQKEYTVVKGDNLWKICVVNYKDGYKWTKVWEANKKIILNPSKLEIGMKLVLPMLN